VDYLDTTYGGSLETMFRRPTEQLRAELLALRGIGPETADAILLYAGNHEVFVADTYARRILGRHQVVNDSAKYEEVRVLVERALNKPSLPTLEDSATENGVKGHQPSRMSRLGRSRTAQIYNEMHGLLVQAGKHYCHKQEARCAVCPLRSLLPYIPGEDATGQWRQTSIKR
jgi:endonuclease-3 related protein